MAASDASSASFQRFAGLCAILVGVVGFLYSVAFVLLQNQLLYSLLLLLGGLLTTAALLAVYQRLRATDESFALWGVLLGIVAALGSAIHGSYDLANAFNPVNLTPPVSEPPNAVNPRGFLTFGVAGLSFWIIGWLITRGSQLPRGLGYLAYVSAALLVITYLLRLIVLQVTPLLLAVVVVEGFIVNPLWYIWLGVTLRRTTP